MKIKVMDRANDNNKRVSLSSVNSNGENNGLNRQENKNTVNRELAENIDELKKVNEELRLARRAALNLMEDTILSKEALRKSEEKYRTLFNTMEEGFVMIELMRNEEGKAVNYKYLEANPAFEKLVGLKPEDVVEKAALDLFPTLDDWLIKAFDKVADKQQSTRFEHYLKENGRWYEVLAYPIFDDHVAILFNNITERKKAEIALRESDERKAFLLKLSDQLRWKSDLVEVQETIAQTAMEHFKSDRCYYCEIEGEQFIIRRDAAKEGFTSVTGVYSISDIPVYKAVVEARKPIIVNNVKATRLVDESLRQLCIQQQLISFVDVPVIKNDALVGILCIVQSTPRNWTEFEIQLVEEVAERTWTAVERAKAQEALHRSEALLAKELDDTRKLQKISSRIIEEGNVDALYEALINSARELMHSDCASIQILNPETNELQLVASNGFHPESLKFWAVVTAEDSGTSCAKALKRKTRVVIPDVDNGDEVTNKDLEEYHRSGVVATQSTPLISRSGKCVGMMSTHWRRVHEPSERKLGLFDLLTRQVADVIERKQGEDALRHSEERFRTLANVVPQIIWTNDANGKANFFNERWYKYSGLDFKDSVDLGWEAIVHPDDAATSKELWQKALSEGKIFDAEYRLRCHDGNYCWFIGRNVPLKDDTGKIIGWFGSATDIEELKKVEESLRLSEELSRIALLSGEMGGWDWDVTQGTVEANEQYFQLLGATPEPGKKSLDFFLKFLHKDDYQRVHNELKKAIEEGIYHSEFRIVHPDSQQVKWMNVYARAVANENNAATRMIGVMYDITGRKKMEQQKDDFIGIASHELKTPLTSIKVYAELLGEIFQEKNDTTGVSYMQKLDSQVDRITELVSTLLDTAKISEGQLSLNLSYFDVNELIDRQIKELGHLSRGHELVFKAGKLKKVKADKERIAQVITNFLTNAIKYSPKGGEVLIKSEDTEEGIRVSVHDTGMGIPEELQDKIFDRFFRIDNPAVKTFPGMGIGLYIAQNIIHRHRGRIGVESKAGEGSEFYFFIPYDVDSK